MADPRTYIRVHDGMPDHPKVDGLSDAAFRLLVTTWCWCSRHLTDGHVPAGTWRKRGTPKARRELIGAGLVREVDGGVVMHDYLEHQRSAEEVQEIRDAKGKGGARGNHIRWHLRRRKVDPDCEYCIAPESDPEDIAPPSQDRSDERSQDRSDKRDENRSRTGNASQNEGLVLPKGERNSEQGADDTSEAQSSENAENSVADGSHNRSVSDRKTSPSTETETETEVLTADVGESSSVRTTAAHVDDDQVIQTIIDVLRNETGRTVDADWADKVRRQILTGRSPGNAAAYVAACLRSSARDYLPTGTSDPASRSVAEAIAAARGDL